MSWERQTERACLKWLIKEKENAINSENVQVRECVRKFTINEEKSEVEKIKNWFWI